MPKIHRLPVDLANQIAAGEVVERPASVVKELVENALDAGARRVTVTVEYGGKRLVRVEDDGEGMEPEDARLALERHATSKIRTSADLAAIATLGFRGEALPSIASVSHLTLRTRARGAMTGTEIKVHGGTVASVIEVGAPEGTRDRRRGSLLQPAGPPEVPQVRSGRIGAGLPHRDAAGAGRARGRVLARERGTPAAGVSAGVEPARAPVPDLRRPGDLIEVHKEAGGIRVTGYAAPLAETGPRRGPQNVFINGRLVRDKTIAHAIGDAYSVASIKERSPEVHLFIEMPLDALDVNVHPTKAEVRFREQSLMHEVIRRAVADALGKGPAPMLTLTPSAVPSAYPTGETLPIPGVLAGGLYPSRWRTDQPSAWGGAGTVHAAPAAALGTAARSTQHRTRH